jgi:type II secretory pathway component PulF
MAVFSYIAIDLDSARQRGTIVADTPRAARDLLRQRGMTVQGLTPHAARGKLLIRRGRHDHKTVAFIRELATLLGVGVPLLEAIDGIARQHKGAYHAVLLKLRDRIAAGGSLTDAMKDQPAIFDDFCINLVEVGESAGTLDTVLDRLAEFKESAAGLKDRVTTALLYPAIVFVMAVGVSLFLMTFVVPNLLDGLIEQGQQIPKVTQVVKFVSDLLVQRWWMLLAGIVVIAIAFAAVLRNERGRFAWHRLLLKLPVAGEMFRKQAILRIAVVMSTLMKNGVIFGRAIQIAQRSTNNLVMRDALAKCEAAVNGGQDIAKSLETTGAFPSVVIQIFSVGQASGRLEEMLDRLAASYDHQLTTAAQRLTAVLEPVLILFLVLVIGSIAFATVLPMLEAANVF